MGCGSSIQPRLFYSSSMSLCRGLCLLRSRVWAPSVASRYEASTSSGRLVGKLLKKCVMTDSITWSAEPRGQRVVKKAKRLFDFSRYNTRHVALRVAYLGWNYHGFAIQEEGVETVEGKLFHGLMKTKLIKDTHSCSYSRCGRTDVGVSALEQVVSLHLRTGLSEGRGVILSEGSKAQLKTEEGSQQELPYLQMLNAVLPDDIRVTGWAAVPLSFSARFSCLQRVYKYYFPCGGMDIQLMEEAAQKFVGEHDFRNFCKMDIAGGVTNFKRRLHSVSINHLNDSSSSFSPTQMYELVVSGNAFLWHQIRCMVNVLFLIGNKLEKPEVIDHLLDVEECPEKPQYGMASGLPLILYSTVFEGIDWQEDPRSYDHVIRHFQNMWTLQMCRTSMIQGIVQALELPVALHNSSQLPCSHIAPLLKGDHKLGSPSYKPLLTRQTGRSLDERLQYHEAKKAKLLQTSSNNKL